MPDASSNASKFSNDAAPLGEFVARHIGPDDDAIAHMLEAIGHESLESLMTAAVPGTLLQVRIRGLP